MKKSMLVVLAGMLLALFSLSGNVYADSDDFRSFVLSNELGAEGEGGLIDQLIAAGHGDDNLYEVLQFLAADPASGIPADFVAEVGNSPAGSDVFTTAFSIFAGLNGPVCINADGTIQIKPIFARDYDGLDEYVSSNAIIPGVAIVRYTLANAPAYYIDAGEAPGQQSYRAIGIAWTQGAIRRTFVISNEAPGYLIDQLIAAGHGDDNLYEVLQLLAAQPGTGIPADFVTEVGSNPPDSEVFTAALSNFAGLNNPVCIHADGTSGIRTIFGRDYDGHTGYVTNQVHFPGIALANFTMAESPTYYIDAGISVNAHYQAIGIAWAGAANPASIPTLNEWGLILLSLAMAGAVLVYMKKRRRAAA